jgi:glycerophosphoryl diester phosphodiesterase
MTTARRTFPFFNIETKTSPAGDGLYYPAPPEFVERLMAVVQAKKLADYVIIQSLISERFSICTSIIQPSEQPC